MSVNTSRKWLVIKVFLIVSAVVVFGAWASVMWSEIIQPPVVIVGDVSYQVLSEKSPRVLVSDDFLTSEECTHIIDMVKSQFQRSKVANSDRAETKNFDRVDEVRTSSGAWIDRNNRDPAIQKFLGKIAKWIDKPKEHFESIQVLEYEIGEQYRPHQDYFDPRVYKQYLENGGQRIASVLCFLNDVDEGGSTSFPVARLEVAPKTGRAILWHNTLPDGNLDPASTHAGTPVKKGKKFVAVVWIREGVRR